MYLQKAISHLILEFYGASYIKARGRQQAHKIQYTAASQTPKNDLLDELWLMIHPLTLGTGKKLFTNGPFLQHLH
jgi:hypothetical protein